MHKDEKLAILQKYQKVASLLGKEDDAKCFGDIISLYKECSNNYTGQATHSSKQKSHESNENIYNAFVQGHGKDLEKLLIHQDIKTNKGQIIDFWDSLNDERKEQFTIFELNIILFLISEQYDKYSSKNKRRIIMSVNQAVRAKKMEKAYCNIKV